MIKDKLISGNVLQTASENNVSEEQVEEVVESVYIFIRKKIQENNYKNMNIDEFNSTKKNFNIPGLGKLYISENKFKHSNKLI